ncbi:MAG TPA: hypothetical protein VMY37_40995 [Thermoguttaceae bacterium]|nr:hypothetical protein [Thermoguttaceae bacterium]
MVDRTQAQLLGYLLGALEESEQDSVENELDQNPKLMQDLTLVRESLQPLWLAQPDYDPPPGLARRTCRFVASRPAPWTNPPPVAAEEPAESAAPELEPVPAAQWGGGGSHASWLDVSMAVGIVAAMSLLVFPAVQNSRFNSRLFTCRDHLRQIGLALTQYSESQNGYFPPVYHRGRFEGAGMYAPVLLSNGFVDGPQWFVCPDSPLAENRRFRIPPLDELLSASREDLLRIRHSMGGSFGYNLGFFEDGRYYSPRNLRRPFYGVAADAPSHVLPNHQTVNHGGRGQNVLLESGGVSFYTTPQPHDRADHVFVNELGMVDAGQHRNDSVIGPSDAVPRVFQEASCGPGR